MKCIIYHIDTLDKISRITIEEVSYCSLFLKSLVITDDILFFDIKYKYIIFFLYIYIYIIKFLKCYINYINKYIKYIKYYNLLNILISFYKCFKTIYYF